MGNAKLSYVYCDTTSSLIYKEETQTKSQKYYKKNRDAVLQRTRNRLRLHTLRLNYIQRKATCSHCGIWDFTVLEFNHMPGVNKLFNIGRTKSKSKSWAKIMNEVRKCEILCANCHKRVTARNIGRAGYGVRVCDSGISPEPNN